MLRNTVHGEQLRRHCNMAILTWYHALLSGRSFTVVDLRQVARMGAEKYRIGASLGALMQAIRVGAAFCWNDLLELGRRDPALTDEVFYEISSFFLYHFDLMSEAVMRGYMVEQSAALEERTRGPQRFADQAHVGQRLSRREFDVLRLLQQGLSNRQIAVAIHVSEDTVKYHLRNIYGKLGVHRRTEAIANAHRATL
ncbi:helix-turn-helix transcriptional regulator [Solimonas marina]|uniref:Response regulator transcription factor n=1 Tax=Solimonas marina TaxID=2714601 RepID=A0A969WEH3_9GAMM|nr:response regulator transcription factor [Solimonas marina]NKF24543.1 response regulator transcription factor [Solimonas marina]